MAYWPSGCGHTETKSLLAIQTLNTHLSPNVGGEGGGGGGGQQRTTKGVIQEKNGLAL